MRVVPTLLRKTAGMSEHGILGTVVTEPALNRLADRLEGDDGE